MTTHKQLIFVYNANSGNTNALLDVAHKLFKPSTYSCSLCGLTYGLVSEKRKWKNFRTKSGIAMQFLHIDEYEKQFKSKFSQKYTYPVVLIQNHYELDIFMNAEKLNQIENLDTLIAEVEKRWCEK
jgi:hypothetical protein